jgi:hypothetical protein
MNVLIDENSLTDIADALRIKTNNLNAVYKPRDMADTIINTSSTPSAISNKIKFGNSLFEDASFIKNCNYSTLDDFSYLFTNCKNLKYIPVINTSNGITFNYMFNKCQSLEKIPAGTLDTSKGRDFYGMFSGCTGLKETPALDFSQAVRCSYMYQNCTNLEIIKDINLSQITNYNDVSSMFYNCSNIKKVYNINLSGLTSGIKFFPTTVEEIDGYNLASVTSTIST